MPVGRQSTVGILTAPSQASRDRGAARHVDLQGGGGALRAGGWREEGPGWCARRNETVRTPVSAQGAAAANAGQEQGQYPPFLPTRRRRQQRVSLGFMRALTDCRLSTLAAAATSCTAALSSPHAASLAASASACACLRRAKRSCIFASGAAASVPASAAVASARRSSCSRSAAASARAAASCWRRSPSCCFAACLEGVREGKAVAHSWRWRSKRRRESARSAARAALAHARRASNPHARFVASYRQLCP